MKGLGFFSGKIYSDEDRRNATECCHVISDREAEDVEWVAKQHQGDLLSCIRCMGCPTSHAMEKEVTYGF